MKRRKRYTKEFKAQVVELIHLGKPPQEVADEFGIASSLLYKWKALAEESQTTQLGSEGPRAEGEESEADELRRLRRVLRSRAVYALIVSRSRGIRALVGALRTADSAAVPGSLFATT